jgi:hypothetical protein
MPVPSLFSIFVANPYVTANRYALYLFFNFGTSDLILDLGSRHLQSGRRESEDLVKIIIRKLSENF